MDLLRRRVEDSRLRRRHRLEWAASPHDATLLNCKSAPNRRLVTAAVLVLKCIGGHVIAQFVSVLREVGKPVQIVGDAVRHGMQKNRVGGALPSQFDRHRFLVKQNDSRAFESTEQERYAVEVGRPRPVLDQGGHAQRFWKLGASNIEEFRQINGCEMWGDWIHGALRFCREARRLKQLSRWSALSDPLCVRTPPASGRTSRTHPPASQYRTCARRHKMSNCSGLLPPPSRTPASASRQPVSSLPA